MSLSELGAVVAWIGLGAGYYAFRQNLSRRLRLARSQLWSKRLLMQRLSARLREEQQREPARQLAHLAALRQLLHRYLRASES